MTTITLLLLIVGIVTVSFIMVVASLFCVHTILFIICRLIITVKPIRELLDNHNSERIYFDNNVYNIQKIKNIKDFIKDFYISWLPQFIIPKFIKKHLIPETNKQYESNSKEYSSNMANEVSEAKVKDITHKHIFPKPLKWLWRITSIMCLLLVICLQVANIMTSYFESNVLALWLIEPYLTPLDCYIFLGISYTLIVVMPLCLISIILYEIKNDN